MPDSEQYERWVRLVPGRGWGTNAHIAAIEAEAVAAERERIAEAVRGLHVNVPHPERWGATKPLSVHEYRAAVLAIVENRHG